VHLDTIKVLFTNYCTVKLSQKQVQHTYTYKDLINYATTLPNCPRRCIVIDYFNKSNFSKIE